MKRSSSFASSDSELVDEVGESPSIGAGGTTNRQSFHNAPIKIVLRIFMELHPTDILAASLSNLYWWKVSQENLLWNQHVRSVLPPSSSPSSMPPAFTSTIPVTTSITAPSSSLSSTIATSPPPPLTITSMTFSPFEGTLYERELTSKEVYYFLSKTNTRKKFCDALKDALPASKRLLLREDTVNHTSLGFTYGTSNATSSPATFLYLVFPLHFPAHPAYLCRHQPGKDHYHVFTVDSPAQVVGVCKQELNHYKTLKKVTSHIEQYPPFPQLALNNAEYFTPEKISLVIDVDAELKMCELVAEDFKQVQETLRSIVWLLLLVNPKNQIGIFTASRRITRVTQYTNRLDSLLSSLDSLKLSTTSTKLYLPSLENHIQELIETSGGDRHPRMILLYGRHFHPEGKLDRLPRLESNSNLAFDVIYLHQNRAQEAQMVYNFWGELEPDREDQRGVSIFIETSKNLKRFLYDMLKLLCSTSRRESLLNIE